jgi:hypothetical protein
MIGLFGLVWFGLVCWLVGLFVGCFGWVGLVCL